MDKHEAPKTRPPHVCVEDGCHAEATHAVCQFGERVMCLAHAERFCP